MHMSLPCEHKTDYRTESFIRVRRVGKAIIWKVDNYNQVAKMRLWWLPLINCQFPVEWTAVNWKVSVDVSLCLHRKKKGIIMLRKIDGLLPISLMQDLKTHFYIYVFLIF